MTDLTRHWHDPAPFTDDEIASMREAADEDRHLARVVATVDALAAQLRATEEDRDAERARRMEHEDTLETYRVLVEHARASADAFSDLAAEERSRREAAEEREGRLEASADAVVVGLTEFYPDYPEGVAENVARLADLLLAADEPEPPRTTREALAELVRASEDDGLYDREFAEARRKAAPQPGEEGAGG